MRPEGALALLQQEEDFERGGTGGCYQLLPAGKRQVGEGMEKHPSSVTIVPRSPGKSNVLFLRFDKVRLSHSCFDSVTVSGETSGKTGNITRFLHIFHRKCYRRKRKKTGLTAACNGAVIIFVIFCYFPLDEWKKRVYNTATYESTQCQPQAAGTFQPLVDTGKKIL